MAAEELLELKFRLYDGTDIGPNKYAPETSVLTLKEAILSQWPKGKTYVFNCYSQTMIQNSRIK